MSINPAQELLPFLLSSWVVLLLAMHFLWYQFLRLKKVGYPDLSVFSALTVQTVQRSQNRTLLLRHRLPTRYD